LFENQHPPFFSFSSAHLCGTKEVSSRRVPVGGTPLGSGLFYKDFYTEKEIKFFGIYTIIIVRTCMPGIQHVININYRY
jgi:hypothetical protein